MNRQKKVNRRIVVLGASGGVGNSLAKYLNRNDTDLIGTYYLNKPLSKTDISWHKVNCNSLNSLESFFTKISNLGGVDAIINCTGISHSSFLKEITFKEIENVIHTNLISAIWVAKLSLKHLSKDGLLVLFSSIVIKTNPKGAAIYSISKAGIEQSTSALSSEFIANGKRINCIRLGYTEYGMQMKIKESVMKKIQSEIPSNRLGNISDIGFLIDYLIDPKSEYANGTILTLSGGIN